MYVDTRNEDNLVIIVVKAGYLSMWFLKKAIQLQVTEGKITLCGSHSNPDPSPVWHDCISSGIHGDIIISH